MQSYRIKCDDGESHVSIEAHVSPGAQNDDGAEDSNASDGSVDLDAANNNATGVSSWRTITKRRAASIGTTDTGSTC
jgi:hypothetical protein